MNIIRQCLIIFGCLAIGELLVYFSDIPLPSSIIGMLLLTILLKLGWIKVAWVQGIADFFIKILPFFFIPVGVAVMMYFDLIAASFWTILIASLGSTVINLVVAGWAHQLLRRRSKRSQI